MEIVFCRDLEGRIACEIENCEQGLVVVGTEQGTEQLQGDVNCPVAEKSVTVGIGLNNGCRRCHEHNCSLNLTVKH